jgi:hypothetical protein
VEYRQTEGRKAFAATYRTNIATAEEP